MPPSASRRFDWTGAVAGIVAGAIAAFVLMWATHLNTRGVASDSPDAGFARDMATHHAQAAEMSFIVRDASTDPKLRTLAYDIIVTQTAQRGVFMGWLQAWGLPQAASGPRMAWMPMHEQAGSMPAMPEMHGDGLMPGMATATEMERLGEARGADAEVLFLQLMIRHHEGGVLMARAAISLSSREEVTTMAKAIDATQSGEIATMREMLGARGAAALPSVLPAN